MNKKERNRKLVKQNKRNRIINRRYISTIKTLTKLFNTKLKTFEVETDKDLKTKLKTETQNILNKKKIGKLKAFTSQFLKELVKKYLVEPEPAVVLEALTLKLSFIDNGTPDNMGILLPELMISSTLSA